MIYGLHHASNDGVWRALIDRMRCRTFVNWACKCERPPEVFQTYTKSLKRLVEDPSDGAFLFFRKADPQGKFHDLVTAITKSM